MRPIKALRRSRVPVTLGAPRGSGGRRLTTPYDADAFGQFAEAIARFLGTARFIVGQTFFVVLWIAFNTIGLAYHWDPYPFILLNLAFSTQAAYAAPLILLAQNRQDDRDRANIDLDREVASRTQADTEFLARELSAVRIAVADTVTAEDLTSSLARLEKTLRRVEKQLDKQERQLDRQDKQLRAVAASGPAGGAAPAGGKESRAD